MLKLTKVCGEALAKEADQDARICVLDGDLADSDGADLFACRHQGRFFQMGIAEQSMVSVAAGMAACGKRPWVFSFAAFLCYRAYDQIRTCISHTGLPVTLVGASAGGLCGRNGKSHSALTDVALIALLQNITIYTPADASDVALAIRSIAAANHPAYIRLPRDLVPDLQGKPAEHRWLSLGSDAVVVVSSGMATHWAFDALELLRKCGVSISHLHLARVWPLSEQVVTELGGRAKKVVVIDDHAAGGGLAHFLRDADCTHGMVTKSWPAGWCGQSGTESALRAHGGFDAQSLSRWILNQIPQ